MLIRLNDQAPFIQTQISKAPYMKKLVVQNFAVAVLFNCLVALFLSIVLGFSFGSTVAVVLTVAVIIGFIGHYTNSQKAKGFAFNAILREISLPEIMSGFYPEGSWLQRARNMDAYVVANTINIAEAGVDPDVLVNNTTYPIQIADREDVNKSYNLDTLDTENTRVGKVEKLLASYDLRQDHIRGHKSSLLVKSLQKAAHAYAPQSNADATPVLATSGSSVDIAGTNFKAITFADILKVAGRAELLKWLTKGGRLVCLLHPHHKEQLMAADAAIFKALVDLAGFNMKSFAGIDFYSGTTNATFNRNTLAKTAFDAAPANTDSPAVSQFFVDTEVMRADGTYDMFIRENDPEYRGDIIGFQKRFIALPMRNQCVASIVTVPA